MAATANFMVSQIGPIAPLQLSVDHFEPIYDPIKSTVAAAGIKKFKTLKVNRISGLKTVSRTPVKNR